MRVDTVPGKGRILRPDRLRIGTAQKHIAPAFEFLPVTCVQDLKILPSVRFVHKNPFQEDSGRLQMQSPGQNRVLFFNDSQRNAERFAIDIPFAHVLGIREHDGIGKDFTHPASVFI